MGSETFIEVLLAILLPPVGVFLRYGCGVMIFFSFSFSFCLYQIANVRLNNNIMCMAVSLYILVYSFFNFGPSFLGEGLLIGFIDCVEMGLSMQVEFWIDLLLTILGYIPGIIYALFVLVG